jgi:hypothetical protein
VDPRAGLDEVEKILDPTGTQLRPLGRPARSQSLYRLRYPGLDSEEQTFTDNKDAKSRTHNANFIPNKNNTFNPNNYHNVSNCME